MTEPLSEKMTFDRARLVELHRRYSDNEQRGKYLAAKAKQELETRIGNREATQEELAEVKMHEYQTIKAAGFKEAVEEIFYIHDGTFEVKGNGGDAK